MADHDDWTEADDALVRRAMATLRADLESTPLPEARFVRARGRALRRRRFLTVGAAAAAAVIVAGTVGYALVGRDGPPAPTPPAAQRSSATTTAPSPSTSTTPASLDTPGLLPLPREWESTLDLPKGSVSAVESSSLDGGVECGDALGKPSLQQSLTQKNSPVSGAATYWGTEGAASATTTLAQGVASCQAGPGFTVKPEYSGAWLVYSYSAGDAGSGWFAVVPGGKGIALLQVVDPAFPDVGSGGFTVQEVSALAELAAARLDRYDTESAGPSTPGAAVDQKMTVTGPDPVPSWKLFVAASQWASPALTKGAKTSDGPGALEGSTAVASCETDDQQAGIGGQVGVVSVRTGSGTTTYLGRQRVQLDDATDAAARKSYVSARLAEARTLLGKGCSFANGTVKSTAGPSAGTYRLDTTFSDGTAPLTEWVGVTAQATPGAVSTIVITRAADPARAFVELDRLLALARQK